MTVNFISERHLRQVHSVITAVAKAERWSPWEALGWLAREAELGTPGLDLIREPTTNADAVCRLPPAESLARWRDMAKRAAANKVDRNDLPVAVMTWCMCEADIAVFARSEGVSPACRQALLALLPEMGHVSVEAPDIATTLSEPTHTETAPVTGFSPESTKQRRDRLLMLYDEEKTQRGERGALTRVTALEKLRRPTAERSNISREIKKARKEWNEERRGGGLALMLAK